MQSFQTVEEPNSFDGIDAPCFIPSGYPGEILSLVNSYSFTH